jgi:hypothetical protein
VSDPRSWLLTSNEKGTSENINVLILNTFYSMSYIWSRPTWISEKRKENDNPMTICTVWIRSISRIWRIFFFHFPILSYFKTTCISCSDSHLRFLINTQNTHFVKDNSNNIPAILCIPQHQKWMVGYGRLRLVYCKLR